MTIVTCGLGVHQYPHSLGHVLLEEEKEELLKLMAIFLQQCTPCNLGIEWRLLGKREGGGEGEELTSRKS